MRRNYYGLSMMVKVGVAQFRSTSNLQQNLARMKALAEKAKSSGAAIVAFPEMAYFTASPEECKKIAAEFPKLVDTFSTWARELGVWLLPGSVREPGARAHYNTLLFFDPSGKLSATYRKIFLFQARLPDRVYEEARQCEAGKDVVVRGDFGFSICFDLRFPELYRRLKGRGAKLVFVPAAFTVPTGKAHWRPLLQARAIENQFFVVAPGQVGTNGDGASTYGHSSVISPWGEVLSDMGETEGVAITEIDFSKIAEAEAKVSAWACRREDLFPF